MTDIKETPSDPHHADDLSAQGADEPDILAEALTEEEDQRILRAIDFNLLPFMVVSYLFQFLDKSALSYTAIMTLRTDLKLSGTEYSWASGIYYVGYLVASYPAAWIMIRSRVGKMISVSILVWGAILMLTSVCSNAPGLLANRFFLGIAESAIAPGLSIIVSMWYKRQEQPIRQGIWFLGNTVAGIVGGVLAYGIGHVQSIAAWKAVFLVFGALTVCWSAIVFFFLPDTPMTARFLGTKDRAKAIKRVEGNMTGIKNNEWKQYQFLEALTDINVWLLVLIQISGQIANGGVHSFGSIVIKGMGFSTLNTLLVQMLGQVFQAVFVIIAMVVSTYVPKSRCLIMGWNLAWSIVGAAMVRQIDNQHMWARFMGYCLTIAYSANFPMLLAMSSSNVGGFTKKTTTNAMIFIAYCAGNIIGPQLFFEREAPSYSSGFLAMLICYSVGILCCILLRWHMARENKRRDGESEMVLEGLSSRDSSRKTGGAIAMSEPLNLADKTDREIPQFRYLY